MVKVGVKARVRIEGEGEGHGEGQGKGVGYEGHGEDQGFSRLPGDDAHAHGTDVRPSTSTHRCTCAYMMRITEIIDMYRCMPMSMGIDGTIMPCACRRGHMDHLLLALAGDDEGDVHLALGAE